MNTKINVLALSILLCGSHTLTPTIAHSQARIPNSRAIAARCDIGTWPADHPGSYIFWGAAYIDAARYEEALACFNIATQDPNGAQDPEAWNGKGVALSGLGEYEQAIQAYDRAIRIQPGGIYQNSTKRRIQPQDYYLWWFNRGTAQVDLNRYDQALVSLDRSLKIRPDYGYAWLYRGLVLYNLGRYDDARASYTKAITLIPNYGYATFIRNSVSEDDYLFWESRAIAMARLKRYKNADFSYQQYVRIRNQNAELEPNRVAIADEPITLYMEGIRLAREGNNREALEILDRAVELYPQYADGWHFRGNVLADLGQNNAAIASYDRALAIEPSHFTAWYQRGNVFLDAGEYREAVKSYDEAINYATDFAEAWHNRGIAMYELGEYEIALQAYDKAIEVPRLWGGISTADSFYGKATALYRLRRYQESLIALNEALEINPEFPAAISLRSEVRDLLGIASN
jgi:tetratricopeptide (TPR) repeat protein